MYSEEMGPDQRKTAFSGLGEQEGVEGIWIKQANMLLISLKH